MTSHPVAAPTPDEQYKSQLGASYWRKRAETADALLQRWLYVMEQGTDLQAIVDDSEAHLRPLPGEGDAMSGTAERPWDNLPHLDGLCKADDDGYCTWRQCPQKRDAEPLATGRHCPLAVTADDSEAP